MSFKLRGSAPEPPVDLTARSAFGSASLALEVLLREPIPAPPRDLEEHLARVKALQARFEDPVDRAAVGGVIADRLGYAFAAGYGAALQRLVPSLGDRRGCLAATESGGGHPRAIQTKLAGGRLVGTKTFATMAPAADELFVVASVGERDGKNELRVVRVPRGRAGLTIEPRPPWPVAPEIPHAIVTFDTAVEEGDVLPGDGYDRYLKPFRTIEDVHVMAATVGTCSASAVERGGTTCSRRWRRASSGSAR